MRFELLEVTLDQDELEHLKQYFSEEERVAACFIFEDLKVLELGEKAVEGMVAITGPIMKYHLFLKRGRIQKYVGELTYDLKAIIPFEDISKRLENQIESKGVADLINELNSIHPTIVEFFAENND